MENFDIEEELANLLNSEEQESHRFNLANLKYSWIIAVFGLAITLATISILFVDKGIIYNADKKHIVSNITAWIIFSTTFVAIIFAAINFIVDRRFQKKLSDETLFRKSIVRIFYLLEQELKKKNLNLDKKLDEIGRITDNFEKAPFENLISWYNAEQIEKNCEKVWSISYTLKWLTEARILNIMEELVKHPNHEYHFIILNKEASSDRINLVKKLKKEFALKYKQEHNQEIHFGTRFYLKYCGENISVPIPNDVSIYQGFADKGNLNHEIVVVNTVEFHGDDETEITLKSNFDFKFEDNRHITRVKKWFDDTWKSLKDK